MRILQVISSFPPAYSYGGALKVAFEISKGLVKKGNDVTVYTTDVYNSNSRLHYDTNPEIMDGIKVYHFRNISNTLSRKNFPCAPSMFFSLKNKIKDFDIIHLHEYRSFQAIFVHHYAKKYGTPYVLQAHGSLPRIMSMKNFKLIFDIFFSYRILRDSSNVIALNQSEAQQYIGMGVPKNIIKIIPNGIDLSNYVGLPPKVSFRKKFHIPETNRIVLYLGRIHKIKGIDYLVKAFANVVKNLDDVKLVIVGPDDGYLNELKILIKILKIEDNILFTGPLYNKNKLEAYLDADVLVLPSRYETFPNVILEAYACSKPVIASNVKSISDIVLNRKTGLLFRCNDIGDLTKKIEYMIENPEYAKRMGCNARNFLEEKFSIEKVVNSLEDLYEEVLY